MSKRVNLTIVRSTRYPETVSLRSHIGTGEPRAAMTAAGFKPGEEVVLIERTEFERLTQSLNVLAKATS